MQVGAEAAAVSVVDSLSFFDFSEVYCACASLAFNAATLSILASFVSLAYAMQFVSLPSSS
jgi:hypothetical protein